MEGPVPQVSGAPQMNPEGRIINTKDPSRWMFGNAPSEKLIRMLQAKLFVRSGEGRSGQETCLPPERQGLHAADDDEQ